MISKTSNKTKIIIGIKVPKKITLTPIPSPINKPILLAICDLSETLETFKPYGGGYIELEGQVRVESRLTESDPEKLKIGMPMELVFDKFLEDEEGNDIISFAFAPITGE